MSYNNLVDIPWETIALLVSVNTLSLDHNLIESVPEGIFSNLHKLARSGSGPNSVSRPCVLNGEREGGRLTLLWLFTINPKRIVLSIFLLPFAFKLNLMQLFITVNIQHCIQLYIIA